MRRLLWTAAAASLAALSVAAPVEGPARAVLAITAFAMVMWVGEVLPLAVTGLLSSLLLVLVARRDAREVFAAYFDPVILLLLGGFVMGLALGKTGLDRQLAAFVMRRAGTRPSTVVLAVMATTAVFSMWIANTAATAIMLPIALGIAAGGAALARCLVLGVAFASNIGGIATPIGTPANPIALRFLADAGVEVSFLGWMVRTVPVAALMVVAAWAVLVRVFPPGPGPLPPLEAGGGFTGKQATVMAVFALTVALWLTTDVHGVSAAMVAVVPIVLLFALRSLDEADIGRAGWPTLLLIGAGLALGDAITGTGLDGVFAGLVEAFVGDQGRLVAYMALAVAGVLMTTFASNTAAAVIMVPMALELATGWGLELMPVAMLVAVSLSMDFLVPVGTPPNAMAYGTGHVRVVDMARAGAVVTLVGVAAAAAAAWMW